MMALWMMKRSYTNASVQLNRSPTPSTIFILAILSANHKCEKTGNRGAYGLYEGGCHEQCCGSVRKDIHISNILNYIYFLWFIILWKIISYIPLKVCVPHILSQKGSFISDSVCRSVHTFSRVSFFSIFTCTHFFIPYKKRIKRNKEQLVTIVKYFENLNLLSWVFQSWDFFLQPILLKRKFVHIFNQLMLILWLGLLVTK